MLDYLFSSKQEQAYILSFGKLFNTKHSSSSSSKITLKSGCTKSYEILKSHGHPNIIQIVKLSRQSVYTKKIIPFSKVFEQSKREYNRYVLSRIRDALDYIHDVLKKECRAVEMDAMAVDESGQIVLCNFERIRDFQSSTADLDMLAELSKELTGTETIEPCGESSKDLFESAFRLNLATAKTETKISILESFLLSKEILPTVIRHHIFRAFVEDSGRDQNKQYKTRVLDFLYAFDDEYFRGDVKGLFSILDSHIRLYLLEKFMNVHLSAEELESIAPDVSLGLLVKDKAVRKLSVEFAFSHPFSTDSMGQLIETMGSCTDPETMATVCSHLLELERDGLTKPIYRLIQPYLASGKSSVQVYRCIDRYFPLFDKVKVTKEILPNLCARLIEKESQEECFTLVEKILNFLKGHKDDLQSRDWTLKSIKGIFGKKQGGNKFEERVSRFSKEELDEWNEHELE